MNILNTKHVVAWLLAALLLAACQPSDTDRSVAVLAVVDGQPITREVLDSYLLQQGLSAASAEQNAIALEYLIRLYVVSAAASADQAFMQQPDLQAQLELAQRRILFERYAEAYVERYPVSDEQLQKQYQETVAASGGSEYRFDALIFNDQAQAMEALVNMQQGSLHFAEMTTGHAQEQTGWLNLAALPKDFRTAVEQTAVNQIVPVPLSDNQSWRIVRIAEKRDFIPPPFDQVSDGMRNDINRKKVQAWIQGLRERAEVELENVSVMQ